MVAQSLQPRRRPRVRERWGFKRYELQITMCPGTACPSTFHLCSGYSILVSCELHFPSSYIAAKAGCLTEEGTRCTWKGLLEATGLTAGHIQVCSTLLLGPTTVTGPHLVACMSAALKCLMVHLFGHMISYEVTWSPMWLYDSLYGHVISNEL